MRRLAALALSSQLVRLCRVKKDLPPRIGIFGQTGTLADLIDRFSPVGLNLLYCIQHGGPGFRDMGARSGLACPLSGESRHKTVP